jgi:uncharacterized protein (TIGR04255 family)
MRSPEYGHPPIAEVVVVIYFTRLPLKSVHIGRIWERFEDNFSRFEDVLPLPPPPPLGEEPVGIIFEPAGALPRVLFISPTEEYVIQVQADRLTLNWRKIGSDSFYPKLDEILERYLGYLDRLEEVATRNNIGKINPLVLEITYVNQIDPTPYDGFRNSPYTFLSKPQAPLLWEGKSRHSLQMSMITPTEELPIYVEMNSHFVGRDLLTDATFIGFQLSAKASAEGLDHSSIKVRFQKCREVLGELFEQSFTVQAKDGWKR